MQTCTATHLTVSHVACSPACKAPTPICGPDNRCTDRRWVESTRSLPRKWNDHEIGKKPNSWTKWVRSIVPVVGHNLTEDAALFEVAYYVEHVLFPGGKYIRKDYLDSMLGAHPVGFQVYPACPKGFMNPGVKPTQSSGGGNKDNTVVTEDWILRYPKCRGPLAVTCDKIPQGTKCNNCGWNNDKLETCRDTLVHEHGHTIDGIGRQYIKIAGVKDDPNPVDIETWAFRIFGDETKERPAFAAAQYFMNPASEETGSKGRAVNAPIYVAPILFCVDRLMLTRIWTEIGTNTIKKCIISTMICIKTIGVTDLRPCDVLKPGSQNPVRILSSAQCVDCCCVAVILTVISNQNLI